MSIPSVDFAEVAHAWCDHQAQILKADSTADVPFISLLIDSGEPCCFACGWRTPDNPYDKNNQFNPDLDFDQVWWNAAPWLDLVPTSHDSDTMKPAEFIILCRHCHNKIDAALPVEEREHQQAIDFANNTPSVSFLTQAITDGGSKDRRNARVAMIDYHESVAHLMESIEGAMNQLKEPHD